MTRATFDYETFAAAQRIIRMCAELKLTLATAESCTGGLVAGALTEIAGSCWACPRKRFKPTAR